MALGNKASCTLALCGAAGAAGLVSSWFEPVRSALFVGWGVALGLTLPSYWSLAWALPRSNKVFFTTFFAGVLFRLTGLALTAYVTWRLDRLPLPVVSVAAVAGLVLLSGIEIYFIQKEQK